MIRLSAFPFWLLIGALASLFGAALLLGGSASEFDRALLVAVQADGLVAPARVVTRLGDWYSFLLPGAVLAGWLAWHGHYRRALILAALLVSERLIVTLLKLGFARARPDPLGHHDAVYTLSFPSGHAANAMTLGLGAALLLTAPGPKRSRAIAAALIFALLVGCSRPVLGVHWPTDVVGGWSLGALWTLLLLRLTAGTSPQPRH